MAQTANSSAEAPTANKGGGKKSFSISITGAVIGAIIIFECVMAYLYLPGGDSATKAAAKKEVAENEHAEMRDVDLGKFSLTAFDPNSNASLLIEFHLVGAIVAGHSEKEAEGEAEHDGFGGHGSKSGDVAEDDHTNFEKLFKQDRNRFRDQVIVIIGNAQISGLTDPGLGLIKAQILAKTNSLLGKPLLKEVRFTEFAVMQQ
jgi:flagellar basal body-associated protein FliL